MRLVLLQPHEYLLPARQQAVLPNRLREVRTCRLAEAQPLNSNEREGNLHLQAKEKKKGSKNSIATFYESQPPARSLSFHSCQEKGEKKQQAKREREARRRIPHLHIFKARTLVSSHSHWISPLTPHATAFLRPSRSLVLVHAENPRNKFSRVGLEPGKLHREDSFRFKL